MEYQLRELQYFVAVAEELHFARAAERLGINQSPLSKAISVMEKNMGVQLFVRTKKNTRLTDVGRALYRDASRILAQVEASYRHISEFAGTRSKRLRLGIADGVDVAFVVALLDLLRQRYPKFDPSLYRYTLNQQLYSLDSEQLDVGLATSYVRRISDRPDVQAFALRQDSMVAFMRSDHPLASQDTVTTLEPRFEPYIAWGELSPGLGTLRGIIKRVPGFRLEVRLWSNIDQILTHVATGHGVGLISAVSAWRVACGQVVIRPLEMEAAKSTTFVLRRRSNRSTITADFVQQARKLAASDVWAKGN